MEQNFQTSFIPKKPIIKENAVYAKRISPWFILALLILFFVILVTGALYFYRGVVKKNITSMETSLSLAKNRFEPSKIAELQVLDKRLRASNEILSKHITITPIFKALEQMTMKSVRYTKFSYQLTGDDSSMVEVKMSGEAIGYSSIALQSDLFAKNKSLIDPVFSNLTLDSNGNVLFDLDFRVDPSLVNYKKNFISQS